VSFQRKAQSYDLLAAPMLSGLGLVAEAAYRQDCRCDKQTDNTYILGHISSTLCPIAQSMSYIANALTSRPLTPKSVYSQSLRNSQSSMHEGSSPEERSELDDNTRPTSIADSLSPKRRSIVGCKPKTAYAFAHPPPVSGHKQHFHIRPRILLQLQKLSKTARPTPVLEVLPSVTFASRVARRLPRTLKGKAGLGADDLVIVNSEKYDTDDWDAREPDDLLDDARWDERDIISVISIVDKVKTEGQPRVEIWMYYGQTWTASILANGSYEFVSTDRHGLRTIARWVRRQATGLRISTPQNRSRAASEEKKFSFSVLNPNSRRHAVIATLDRHSIEVSDRYNSPSMSPNTQEPTTPTASLSEASVDGHTQPTELAPISEYPIEVDEALRNLILVTGVWVAFQEGASNSSNNHEVSNGQSISTKSNTKHQRRSVSLAINQFNSNQAPTSTNISPAKPGLLKSSSNSAVPLSLETTSPVRTPPRRTQSTGAAFMRRVTSRSKTTNKLHELSPVGDLEGSETERGSMDMGFSSPERMQNRELSCATGSPLRPRAPSYEDSLDFPLSPVISCGQDPPKDASVSTEVSTRKARRLSKMFGLKRRTGGAS